MLFFQAVLAHAFIGGQFPGKDFPGAVSWSWGEYSCSGTKLSNHLILTAAHCFLNATDFNYSKKAFPFVIGGPLGNYTDPNHVSTKVVQVITHENWLRDGDTQSDLALIQVEDAGPRAAVKVGTQPVDTKNEVIVGGFGCKGPSYPNYAHLTVSVKIPQEIHSGEITFGVPNSDGNGASMGCFGDSGGGVYRMDESNQAFEIVGVNHAVNFSAEQMPQIFKVDADSGKLISWDGQPTLMAANLTDPHILQWLKSKLPKEAF
jgi:hypothetical protein